MAAGSRWQPQRHWATSADWVFLSVWLIRKCFKAFPWAATFLGGPKRSSTSAHWPLNRHENHANWLQSTSDAVLFLDIDLAVPTLDFDLAVPALDMTPLAWATRKRTRQGSRLRATCIMSIHDSSSRDLWSANVLLHWQTMMFSGPDSPPQHEGRGGDSKLPLESWMEHHTSSQQNLRVWKKQWFLKDPPVLSGGEVVPSEQFTKPSFSIHVHCATSG